MAGERIRLEVRQRERRGSADARRLRKEGLIPGVLYGRGNQPHPICIPERELRRVLTGQGGLNAILDVVLEGQQTTHASILKEFQQDPIRGHISHVDFQEVRLDQTIHATVTVHLVGEPEGAKEGGVLSQVQREINIEALPIATVTLPTREVEPEEVTEEGEEVPEGEVPGEERPEGAADQPEEPAADAAGEQGTVEG
jgi:large subunit ribosomal protein L25